MGDLRIRPVKLAFGGGDWEIVFTLAAIDDLQEEYGSMAGLFEDLASAKRRGEAAVRIIEAANCGRGAACKPHIPAEELNAVVSSIVEAFCRAMPKPSGKPAGGRGVIDVDLLVMRGMRELRLPERELWEMTPRKVLAMLSFGQAGTREDPDDALHSIDEVIPV